MHYATVLEGSARHTGIHAAGVIIAPGDVSDYVPVAVQKGKCGAPDAVVTQYDGKWIEEFGLLKMDFLGLKTLTILDDALALIKENHGVEIDLDAIPLDDPDTYRLFQRGDTVAIFQFESSGMREWMRKLKPTSLDDLIAMNALYRPGPMDLIPDYIDRKHGKEVVEYPHEMLRGILEPTYGIPVYQEQVMQMAQVMGGFSLGGADLLRRAMGKKDHAKMAMEKEKFVEGAGEKGVDEAKAVEVFDMMAKFAGYGFNKSHSAAYSVVAYQTAYLKAHYPAEFMAAVMTTEMSDSSKMAIALEATRQAGIDILPPCVNRSSAYFNVENGACRFGLGAIKGVGLGAIESLLDAREKAGGAFEDLFEMVRDLDLRTVGKKTIEALAQAGALDMFEGHRAQLAEAVPLAWQYAQKHQADTAAGQNSLFGGRRGRREPVRAAASAHGAVGQGRGAALRARPDGLLRLGPPAGRLRGGGQGVCEREPERHRARAARERPDDLRHPDLHRPEDDQERAAHRVPHRGGHGRRVRGGLLRADAGALRAPAGAGHADAGARQGGDLARRPEADRQGGAAHVARARAAGAGHHAQDRRLWRDARGHRRAGGAVRGAQGDEEAVPGGGAPGPPPPRPAPRADGGGGFDAGLDEGAARG